MGTSYSQLITDLRALIRESTANTWTDGDLVLFISPAEQWLAGYLAQLRGSGRFRYEEQYTLAASTETVAITTLFATKGDDSGGIFAGLNWINMRVTNNAWQPVPIMPAGDENLHRWPTSVPTQPYVVPHVYLLGDNVVFLPTSAVARVFRVSYNWIPVKKTSAGTAETPAQYDDLLLRRAAHDALALVGQAEGSFEDKYATRLAELEDFEFGRINKGTSTVVQNVSGRTLFPTR